MDNFSRFNLTHSEGHAKLARYRHEATRARLLPRVPLRARLARGLHHLAERLEPTPTSAARQSPRPIP